jgi:hypothetical protein
MSIFNIVIGIVIAWLIIKALERFADLLGGSKNDVTENRSTRWCQPGERGTRRRAKTASRARLHFA